MKEFVTSISRSYLALVAVSASLLAFSLTPNEARHLDRAALQLTAFKQILRSTWDIVDSRYGTDPLEISENKRVINIVREYAKDFKIYRDDDTGAPLFTGPETDYVALMSDSLAINMRYGLNPNRQRYAQGPSDKTLRSVFNSIISNSPSLKFNCISTTQIQRSACSGRLPPGSELASVAVVDRKMTDPGFLAARAKSLMNDEILSPEVHDWQLNLDFFHFNPLEHREYHIIISDYNPAHPIRFFHDLEMGQLIEQNTLLKETRENPIAFYLKKRFWNTLSWFRIVSGDPPIDWNSHHPFNELNDIYGIWSMTFADAEKNVREKASNARERLSIFGQSFNSDLLEVGGPLLLLAITLFFLAELRALRVALHKYLLHDAPSGNEDDLVFSWIGFQGNIDCVVITGVTVILLPLTAAIFTWLQLSGTFDGEQLFFMIVAALIGSSGIVSVVEMRRIRLMTDEIVKLVRLKRRAERRSAIHEKIRDRNASRMRDRNVDDCC